MVTDVGQVQYLLLPAACSVCFQDSGTLLSAFVIYVEVLFATIPDPAAPGSREIRAEWFD